LPAVAVFGVGAPLELLVFGTLGEQMAAIANIDSVSLYDALGVGNPWVKMYEKRIIIFVYLRSGLPERQGSKMASMTGEGIRDVRLRDARL
jgi:hypothetical protein